MSDFILLDGDQVLFNPSFGLANVVSRPGQLTAHGAATIQGKKISVSGDEKEVSVPGCIYTTSIHSIPGIGVLTIAELAEDQIAQKTYTARKKVLLKGSQFKAKLTVQTPAQQPPPGPGSPQPDSNTEYQGTGYFMNSNTQKQGS